MASVSKNEEAEMLSQMFGLSASICMEILKENGFEVDKAVDEILTMKYVNSSTIRAPPKVLLHQDRAETLFFGIVFLPTCVFRRSPCFFLFAVLIAFFNFGYIYGAIHVC